VVEEVEGNVKFTYSSLMVVLLLFLLLIASSAVLQGCSKSPVESVHAGAKHHLDREKKTPDAAFLGMDIQPIQPGDEEFHKAAGWLTNGSILYITNNNGDGSSLYSYTLGSGKSEILYKSAIPIVTAEISPDKERILVHKAVSNKGVLTIIDLEGKEIYSANIESYELNFEWNPFNHDLIAVSAFTEDWDFKTFLLDLKQNKMIEHEIPEPFIRWVSDHEFAYQEWEEGSMTLQAPVKIVSFKDNKSERSLDSVYLFDTLGKFLLTVAIENENELHRAQYTLYSEGLKQVASFDAPLLTSFSGWLVPFYDLMDDGKYFLYLRALHEGEADIYEDGFELVRYELDTQEEEVILTGLNNENISCSPSGNLCLYGFQLERVINMDSKEMTELIQ
jgi:hypothetical protein